MYTQLSPQTHLLLTLCAPLCHCLGTSKNSFFATALEVSDQIPGTPTLLLQFFVRGNEQVTFSNRCLFQSSRLSIITSSNRHVFQSSRPPIVTSSHRHVFPSSHPPIVTSSHRHVFPLSRLPIVTGSNPWTAVIAKRIWFPRKQPIWSLCNSC